MKVLGAWIARCALGVIFSSAVLAAQAHAAVPNPAVQGPIEGGIRGHPWNHTLFPLSGKGYSYGERVLLQRHRDESGTRSPGAI